MKSGGFSLSKKQKREDAPKRLNPPSSSDLFNLLASAQRSPDKPFTLSWQSASNTNWQFTLSVVICAPQRDQRGGWAANAMDHSGVGEAEWRLVKDDGKLSELFKVRSSDADLIVTLVEEAVGPAGAAPSLHQANSAGGERHDSSEYASLQQSSPQSQAGDPFQQQGAHGDASQSQFAGQESADKGKSPYEEGNLRQMSVRKLMEHFNANQITGRLICEVGTMQAEIFLKNGEPIHAKSCHSIYQDRDATGDAVMIDVLTWKDGTFKFNKDWPAASKSVTQPLHKFLSGDVTVSAPPAAPPASSNHAQPSSPTQQPVPAGGGALYSDSDNLASNSFSSPAASPGSGNPDDFSKVDELVQEAYSRLVDRSGSLTYGIWLMLARSEFIRFTASQKPFCIAAIGLDLHGHPITDEMLSKIVECFEGICQPLDILTCNGWSRMYALFPHSSASLAGNTLRHFINTVKSAPLSGNVHGSNLGFSVGLAEVPRDGADFQQVLEHACRQRAAAAAPDKAVGSAAG